MPLINLDQANAFETSALPGIGDVNAGGGGIDTSSLTNEAALASYGLDTQSQSARGSGGTGGLIADNSGNLYSQQTGAKVGRAITPGLSGNPQAEHPLWTILLLVVLLFGWKFISKEKNEEGGMVKVSISNFARITLMAAVGILLLKWFFGVYAIASISPTIEFL